MGMNLQPFAVLLFGLKTSRVFQSMFSMRIRYSSRTFLMPVSRVSTMMSFVVLCGVNTSGVRSKSVDLYRLNAQLFGGKSLLPCGSSSVIHRGAARAELHLFSSRMPGYSTPSAIPTVTSSLFKPPDCSAFRCSWRNSGMAEFSKCERRYPLFFSLLPGYCSASLRRPIKKASPRLAFMISC